MINKKEVLSEIESDTRLQEVLIVKERLEREIKGKNQKIKNIMEENEEEIKRLKIENKKEIEMIKEKYKKIIKEKEDLYERKIELLHPNSFENMNEEIKIEEVEYNNSEVDLQKENKELKDKLKINKKNMENLINVVNTSKLLNEINEKVIKTLKKERETINIIVRENKRLKSILVK